MSVPLALLTDSADRPRTFRQEAAREGGREGGDLGPRLPDLASLTPVAPRHASRWWCPFRAMLRWPQSNPPDSRHHPASTAKPPQPRIEVYAPIIYHLYNHSLAILAKLHTLSGPRSAMGFTWCFAPFVPGTCTNKHVFLFTSSNLSGRWYPSLIVWYTNSAFPPIVTFQHGKLLI